MYIPLDSIDIVVKLFWTTCTAFRRSFVGQERRRLGLSLSCGQGFINLRYIKWYGQWIRNVNWWARYCAICVRGTPTGKSEITTTTTTAVHPPPPLDPRSRRRRSNSSTSQRVELYSYCQCGYHVNCNGQENECMRSRGTWQVQWPVPGDGEGTVWEKSFRMEFYTDSRV